MRGILESLLLGLAMVTTILKATGSADSLIGMGRAVPLAANTNLTEATLLSCWIEVMSRVLVEQEQEHLACGKEGKTHKRTVTQKVSKLCRGKRHVDNVLKFSRMVLSG